MTNKSPGTGSLTTAGTTAGNGTHGREGVKNTLVSSSHPLFCLLRCHWLPPAGSQETPSLGEHGLQGQLPRDRSRTAKSEITQARLLCMLSNTQSWVCRFVPSDAHPPTKEIYARREGVMGRVEGRRLQASRTSEPMSWGQGQPGPTPPCAAEA